MFFEGEVYANKNTAERDPKAMPAVVVLDIPKQLVNQMGGDTQSDGLTCRCTIPPQHIKEVVRIPFEENYGQRYYEQG